MKPENEILDPYAEPEDKAAPELAVIRQVKAGTGRRILRTAIVLVVALGLGVAAANPPQQDHPCSMRHAAMRDADGHMMKCDRMMNGAHGLVWQYTLGS